MQKYLTSVLIIFIVFGCNPSVQNKTEDYKKITDALGREIMVPENVQKVVGLRAGTLRLLVYMDVVNLIAGIEEAEKRGNRPYILAHPDLLNTQTIGPTMGGEPELILKAMPDVIFMSYTTRGDADALQSKTGVPVIAIECPEFGTERERLFKSFRIIGNVINRSSRADSLISYIENSISFLQEMTTQIPENKRPTAYIGGVSYSGAHGISSTQPYYPPFMFTNTKNVASTIDERLISHVKGTFVDIEKIMMWDPEYLFIDESGLQQVKSDFSNHPALYEHLNAIKNDKVYTLFAHNNYATNYELVLANAWYIGKIVYPEHFEKINIQAKAAEILKVFLGQNIYKELEQTKRVFKTIQKSAL